MKSLLKGAVKLSVAISGIICFLPAMAVSKDTTETMLNSTVYVGCEVQFQGDVIMGGSGSGFLVADSEYVVTNNHVVDYCCPDNKLKVIKELFVSYYIDEFEKGKWPPGLKEYLAQKPKLVARIKRDNKLAVQVIKEWVNALAAQKAKENFSNISQNLYVMVMGKEGQQAIKIDVFNIAWASSEKSHQDSHDVGVDIAVLKLSRQLSNRPSVNFATGSSAKVNDVVYTVGFPGDSGNVVSSVKYVPTLKKGIVSKLGGESPQITEKAKAKGWKGVPVIETDAAINPGNSGGPLFNEYGEVLGVNTFGPASKASGIGWAQDISVVIPILKDLGLPLPKIRETPRTWLDKNVVLVGASSGAIVLVMLLVGSWLLLRRRRSAPVPATGSAKKIAKSEDKTTKPPTASANPAIRGRAGEFSGVKIPIPSGGLTLGRQGQGAGMLGFSDQSVSRQHCTIRFDATSRHFEITDLGSANGTYILPEGKKLPAHQKYICNKGKAIRLGQNNEFELMV